MNGYGKGRPSKDGIENEGFEMSLSHPDPRSGIIANRFGNNYIADMNENPDSFGYRRKSAKPSADISKIEEKDEAEVVFKDLPFDPNDMNIIARVIHSIRSFFYQLVVTNKKVAKYCVIALIFVLYNAYFVTSIVYNRTNHIDWDWCDGHGLLIILTGLTYWSLLYYHVIKRFFGKSIYRAVMKPVSERKDLFSNRILQAILVLLVIAGVIAFIVIDSWDNPKRMISALGVIVMLTIGLLLSRHPGRVKWRQVLGGLAFQFLFGLIILRWQGGRDFVECISTKVSRFLSFADEGSSFIYGYLASGNLSVTNSSYPPLEGQTILFGTLFAFQALSVIYFFSFFVGLLYHLGIMTWVVMKVGWVLQIFLGTTAAESMNASANIFLGQTEAPILIKPYLSEMTKSEIHAVMTGGFATIAGGVMAAYISFGVNASSLLSASVMAAPAALALSKLLYPETQESRTKANNIKAMSTKEDGNALDAAAQGAAQGFVLVGNIIANLIAVIAFVAFLNAIISWLGVLVGQEQLSFEWILGKIFVPFAICLGVDTKDVNDVGLLLGLKTVVNEFVAYQRLLKMDLTPRSKRIAEYALCSFANFSSVGIQLGGLATMAPNRRKDFSAVVWSALVAGTLASLLNACIAGALIDEVL